MATTWTVETEPGIVDSGKWTNETDPAFDDSNLWCAYLNPDAAARNSFLGVTESPENFRVFPEDVLLEPEFVQEDETQWVIEPEAT